MFISKWIPTKLAKRSSNSKEAKIEKKQKEDLIALRRYTFVVMIHKKDYQMVVEIEALTVKVHFADECPTCMKNASSQSWLLFLSNPHTRILKSFPVSVYIVYSYRFWKQIIDNRGSQGKMKTTLKKVSLYTRNSIFSNKEMPLRDEYSLKTWRVFIIYHTVLYRIERLCYTNNFSIFFCKYLISRSHGLIRFFFIEKTVYIAKRIDSYLKTPLPLALCTYTSVCLCKLTSLHNQISNLL